MRTLWMSGLGLVVVLGGCLESRQLPSDETPNEHESETPNEHESETPNEHESETPNEHESETPNEHE
ncbi:MAG: hypothetical protein IT385_08255, partial [Deltaproteobacteria bacterium]|nr:hypothetical protein [Deltaproteobacteria bacterium]